jgi:hypothetical protein
VTSQRGEEGAVRPVGTLNETAISCTLLVTQSPLNVCARNSAMNFFQVRWMDGGTTTCLISVASHVLTHSQIDMVLLLQLDFCLHNCKFSFGNCNVVASSGRQSVYSLYISLFSLHGRGIFHYSVSNIYRGEILWGNFANPQKPPIELCRGF